jgi:tetratricopeptide (TPR) repeat protein
MACQFSSRLLVAALLLSAAGARAQDLKQLSPEDENRARQAYLDGNAAYKLGKYEEAAKNFEQAYRISKFENILFDMGQTYRRWYEDTKDLEKLKKAIEMYKGFLRDAKPDARQRPIAERLTKELAETLKSETKRRRDEQLARAQGANALFLVDKLIADNELQDASNVLDRVLASRGQTRDVVVGAYEKRGLVAGALAAKGNKAEQAVALESFQRALALDPGFQLPDDAEKNTVAAFQEAQKNLKGKRPVSLTHVPPGDVPKAQAVKIPVTVESDPLDMITELVVFYRRSGAGAFSSTRAAKTAAAVEIPATFLHGMRGGTKIDYYIAALDQQDDEIANLGNAKEPFVFAVALDPSEIPIAAAAPVKETPTYKKWWPWTILAVVVVGATAGGLGYYFATRGSVDNPSTQVPVPSP